jgi:hypothetical protein
MRCPRFPVGFAILLMYRSQFVRHFTRSVLLLVLLVAASPVPARADVSSDDPVADVDEGVDRRVYFAMWTVHLRDLDRGIDSNRAFGVSWGRIYAATLINSFENRAYTAGFQDTLVRWEPGIFAIGLGYRAGFITGYDERFMPFAGRTPIVPLAQPLLLLDVSRLGVDLSYSGVVASLGLNVRF